VLAKKLKTEFQVTEMRLPSLQKPKLGFCSFLIVLGQAKEKIIPSGGGNFVGSD